MHLAPRLQLLFRPPTSKIDAESVSTKTLNFSKSLHPSILLQEHYEEAERQHLAATFKGT
eukprot:1154964-Pelagomonas_calceolata.AAC.1